MGILQHTLTDPIIIDGPAANVVHNERARFLRNGLAIISFNILEDFFKQRIGEVLQHVATSPVQFQRLPVKIQEATLLSSLAGIQKIADRMRKNGEDWRTFIQTEANKLSSSAAMPYLLSSYGMGYKNSNLSEEEIASFLGAFQVEGAWQGIEQVTNLIGCSVISAKTQFVNAANRRHAAAHDPNVQTPLTDIKDFANCVKSIALGFDFLISQAAHYLKNNHLPYINATAKIRPTDLHIRFIRKIRSTSYQEMDKNNRSVIKIHTDEATAVASLRSRRNYTKDMIVVVDYPSYVESWYTSL
ncbi:hypothetical protein F0L74_29600 [Chitinophaga agrisoli]|uniref:RiboL-PSP-HEPN domain-containing protein n=1 Tax=Chitinophaga agrisoli TaxID=2607653 RepID=A0A5B2VNM7_9BACT|nr:hypothetical protein [Chitinophaga agrisoli]KAA2240318.1 hypothetical protein F0L74_29600 [Chitinophaga agrisoli]